MARKKRIWYPGATYHVMSRGNRRVAIYNDQADYMWFLYYIQKIKEIHPFKIHSICLMTNHFHALIETEGAELWKIMQKILSVYAEAYNHRHGFTGHLFEGRYVAQLVEDERYFLEASRYIHLNPVKAQMVRGPLDYEYSSYGLFVNDIQDSEPDNRKFDINHGETRISALIKDLVYTDRVLNAFHHNNREQYRMFVEGKISHREQEMLIQKDMREDEKWLPW